MANYNKEDHVETVQRNSWQRSELRILDNMPTSNTIIVVCLSTPWGINNKSEVDILGCN